MGRVLQGPSFDRQGAGYEVTPRVRSRALPNPVVPTGDYRHIERVRAGTISFEVFVKNPADRQKLRLAKLEEKVERIPEPEPIEEEQGGEVETDNASEKPPTTKVGVRRQRRSVGKKTSHEPAEKKTTKKKTTRRAQAPKTGDKRQKHKKESVKSRLARIKGEKK